MVSVPFTVRSWLIEGILAFNGERAGRFGPSIVIWHAQRLVWVWKNMVSLL